MASRQRGIAATSPDDAIRKAELDASVTANVFPSFVPPVGYSINAPGLLGGTATALAVGQVNVQRFHPFLIGRTGWMCSGPVIGVSGTATAGGAGLKVTVALYAMDPATGYPDTSTILRTADITTLSPGNQFAAWAGGDITLVPGTYFVSATYTHTTAPTTYPTVTMIANATWYFPAPTGPTITVSRTISLAGQSTPKATATLPTAFTISGNTDAIVVGLRRAP